LSARDGAAHRFLGVVLHVAHVGLHHGQAELLHHLAQLLHALFVGGNLRLQVGQVLLRVAAEGIRRFGQQGQHFGLAQHPALDQLEVVDLHALFLDARGKRRHRARRDAAHVGMVAPAAHVEDGLRAVGRYTGVITVMSGRCVPPW
jgi:hypothetical protein